MKEWNPSLVEQIEKDYEAQKAFFGSKAQQIENGMETQEEFTKLLCQFIYAYLPLSDAGDYPFEIIQSYAQHAAFLYENSAYTREIPVEYFLNYVVAPRINSEDLTNCRSFFYEQLKDRVKGLSVKEAVLEVNNWCYEQATYRSTSERTASPITVYKGGYGRCGEESTFLTTALRSLGIPARQVYVPRWSHSDSNHAWVEAWVDGEWLFTGACEPKPIYNCGWFPYAASRAMVVHSIVFSPFTCREDEVMARDGVTRVLNNAKLYAHQKEIKIHAFEENGKPAAGARIQFEIVNSSEFYPVVTVVTDCNGEASVKLGFGTVHVYGVYGQQRSEQYVYIPDTEEIEIHLGKEVTDGQWKQYMIHAPESAVVKGVETNEEQEQQQNARNAKGDMIRKKRIDAYYDESFAEQYRDYPQIMRVLRNAKGNFDEIRKFLLTEYEGIGLEEKNRLLACLTQKDCRDVTANVLMGHLEAFAMEKEVMEGVQNHTSERTMVVDAESKADSEDMDAEFYHAEMDFFTEYVVSPRIYIERLTDYRAEIKAALGQDNPFSSPAQIWEFITENCDFYEEREYTTIMATPGAVLALNAGSIMAQHILFVAICRTYGIPARIDMMYHKAQYFDGMKFVYAEPGICADSILELEFTDKKLPAYFTQFTLEYEQEDGTFLSLDYQDFFLNMQKKMNIALIPGVYRIVTCTRTKTGSVVGRTVMFRAESKKTTRLSVTCREQLEDSLITRHKIPAVRLQKTTGKSFETDRNDKNQVQLFCFLKPGQEPTEHVLNEFLEEISMGQVFECPVYFVLRDISEANDKTFVKVCKLMKHELFLDPQGKAAAELSKATETGLESYPYLCLMEGNDTSLFAESGYKVGIIDMIERLLEEREHHDSN